MCWELGGAERELARRWVDAGNAEVPQEVREVLLGEVSPQKADKAGKGSKE